MKIYIIKKQVNLGEFEDPVRYQSTSFAFMKKENAERLAEKLNDIFPDCKGSWSIPFCVEEVDLLEDYTTVPDRLRCHSCSGTGKYSDTSNFPCSYCNGLGIRI